MEESKIYIRADDEGGIVLNIEGDEITLGALIGILLIRYSERCKKPLGLVCDRIKEAAIKIAEKG
ncbi:MAG: hypothetical protein J6O04_09650 [Selenomonadaceae bacterium]|nr:hypothetical protein [Selenomonadaceae bacterium]